MLPLNLCFRYYLERILLRIKGYISVNTEKDLEKNLEDNIGIKIEEFLTITD
jgi:hypothetical protein